LREERKKKRGPDKLVIKRGGKGEETYNFLSLGSGEKEGKGRKGGRRRQFSPIAGEEKKKRKPSINLPL